MSTQEMQVYEAETVEDERGSSLRVISEPDSGALPTVYGSASTLSLTKEESAALLAPFDADQMDIRPEPEGLVYISHNFLRQRLNDVFGPGQWSMVPMSEPIKENNKIYQWWAMFVRGVFVSQAIGSAGYFEDNPRADYSDALETVKSETLRRLAKDIGVGLEAWDKRYAREWRSTHAVEVWAKNAKTGKTTPAWRRVDETLSYPLEETGIKTAPNKGTNVPNLGTQTPNSGTPNRKQETASRPSDAGNGEGGSRPGDMAPEVAIGPPEPGAPESGDVPELRDLKDGETLGVFEIRELKPTPDRKYTGQARLLDGRGDTLGGQWGVNMFSDTDWETLMAAGIGNRIAVIYTINGKWVNVQAVGRAS